MKEPTDFPQRPPPWCPRQGSKSRLSGPCRRARCSSDPPSPSVADRGLGTRHSAAAASLEVATGTAGGSIAASGGNGSSDLLWRRGGSFRFILWSHLGTSQLCVVRFVDIGPREIVPDILSWKEGVLEDKWGPERRNIFVHIWGSLLRLFISRLSCNQPTKGRGAQALRLNHPARAQQGREDAAPNQHPRHRFNPL